MCIHNRIVVSHYSRKIDKTEPGEHKSGRIKCMDCNKVLLDTKDSRRYNEDIFNYVKKNRDNISILEDGTCEDLNYIFKISSRNVNFNLVNLLKNCLETKEIKEDFYLKDSCEWYIQKLQQYGEEHGLCIEWKGKENDGKSVIFKNKKTERR